MPFLVYGDEPRSVADGAVRCDVACEQPVVEALARDGRIGATGDGLLVEASVYLVRWSGGGKFLEGILPKGGLKRCEARDAQDASTELVLLSRIATLQDKDVLLCLSQESSQGAARCACANYEVFHVHEHRLSSSQGIELFMVMRSEGGTPIMKYGGSQGKPVADDALQPEVTCKYSVSVAAKERVDVGQIDLAPAMLEQVGYHLKVVALVQFVHSAIVCRVVGLLKLRWIPCDGAQRTLSGQVSWGEPSMGGRSSSFTLASHSPVSVFP